MRRLVYSPKAWVYIKGRVDPNSGQPILYDVSNYVVSGSVSRRVNEISSAEIILRNPNRIFTQLGNPAFLPMDPITIFLQRHATNPVRVFTGWLDESPYYQMRPGTCTLAASCTLKKLQYTFWDPALPFVMDFLKQIGWGVDVSNGLLVHPSTLGGGPVVKGNISNTKLTDGGFGALLYAVMKVVGGWNDNNIYIENLPPTIVPWITSLFKSFQSSSIIPGSTGTGGTGGTPPTGGTGTGDAWQVIASSESAAPSGGAFKCQPGVHNSPRGYTVLSASGAQSDTGTAGYALNPNGNSSWDCSNKINIYYPPTKTWVTDVPMLDIGAGDSSLPCIGLMPQTRADLGIPDHSDPGNWNGTVIIQSSQGSQPITNPASRATKVTLPGGLSLDTTGNSNFLTQTTGNTGGSSSGNSSGGSGGPTAQEETVIKDSFEQFFRDMIGTTSFGSGGGSTTTTTTPTSTGPTPAGATQANVQTVYCIATQYKVPPELVMAVICGECGWKPSGTNQYGTVGWFQWTSQTPYPNTNYGSSWQSDAMNLTTATIAFCKAMLVKYPNVASQSANWQTMASLVQGCSNPGATPCYSNWSSCLQQSQSLISQFCQNLTCVNGAPQTSAPTSGSGGTPTTKHSTRQTQSVKKSFNQFLTLPTSTTGGNTGGSKTSSKTSGPSVNSNGVINPIPGWHITTYDAGVDATAPAGTAILAPADCTYVPQYNATGWYPTLYMFEFTNTLPGAPTVNGKTYMYIAEGVNAPTGTSFKQGDIITTSNPSLPTGSIEIGWGSPIDNSRTLSGNTATHNPAGTPFGTSFKNYFSIGGGSPVTGSSGGTTTTTGAGGSTDPFVIAKATAFATELQWPSIAQTIEAVALQGHKSLMNDKPLMQFIQQVCSASMRSFQSAPNGDFYAFFPDYFGEFGHKPPYWRIDDVEVITGDIQLNDSNLVTHMYVVGDTLMAGEFPNASTELLEKILSAGTVDIFDYFGSTLNHGSSKAPPQQAGSKTGGYTATPLLAHSLHTQSGAEAFLTRYGARPVELDEPLIRSQFYEAFMAVEQFMLAWSLQFITDFTFTFMPELYPGARVQFGPPHDINMYINSVTHTFDYEQGFTTSAELTAPSAANPSNSTTAESPSWGMVNAIR